MGAGIPIYCDVCRRLYAWRGIVISGQATIHAENIVGECPKGHEARVLDGTYTLRNNILTLSAADPRALSKIRTIAEKAMAGAMSYEKARDEILELSPTLGPALKDNASSLLPWLALLVYLIVEIGKIAAGSDPKPTVIENSTTIKNEIFIEQQEVERSGKGNYSKRKQRRIRGKLKEANMSKPK